MNFIFEMTTVDSTIQYLVRMFEGNEVKEVTKPPGSEVSLQERLFRELSQAYTHPKSGLTSIGKTVGIEILPPKKRITVLLIGNHSAGKSSFINWYIGDNIQKTGMAIETQCFTVITSGKKRETLMGPATVFLFPHLKSLGKIEGVLDYLNCEISTSKKRQFPMVTFIDTPGLVDGGMEYPYNVNDTISFLGGVADLIFVFFDPIGLALSKRTMEVVEKINSCYSEKLHFYLSKSDEIKKQTEKQKIMMQITQEVCRHAGLNRSGFTMPSIFLPPSQTLLDRGVQRQQSGSVDKAGDSQESEDYNEIEEVCKQIEQTISRTLQTALHNFDKDINSVLEEISKRLSINERISNWNRTCLLLTSFVMILFFGVLISTGLHYLVKRYGLDVVSNNFHIQKQLVEALTVPAKLVTLSVEAESESSHLYLGFFILILSTFYFLFCKICLKPTLPRREVKELIRMRNFILNDLMVKKVKLTEEYIEDSCDL